MSLHRFAYQVHDWGKSEKAPYTSVLHIIRPAVILNVLTRGIWRDITSHAQSVVLFESGETYSASPETGYRECSSGAGKPVVILQTNSNSAAHIEVTLRSCDCQPRVNVAYVVSYGPFA